MALWLVRHGETEWSLSGQHTGTTDLPLTPEGELQAKAIGHLLAGRRFDHVRSSPMARARRTAELAGLGDRGGRPRPCANATMGTSRAVPPPRSGRRTPDGSSSGTGAPPESRRSR